MWAELHFAIVPVKTLAWASMMLSNLQSFSCEPLMPSGDSGKYGSGVPVYGVAASVTMSGEC